MYDSIKMIYESDCIEWDLFDFILYIRCKYKGRNTSKIGFFFLVFQMKMLIVFTCETRKTVRDDSDYWVNNACLRI